MLTDRSMGTARGEERKEMNVHDDSAISEEKRFIKKIYIENNRFVQIQDYPIIVEGAPETSYEEYFIRIKDNRISNCGLESKLYALPGATEEEKESEKEQIKQAYDRLGGEPQSCIYLGNLFIYNLACSRNTISKGSGSGIKLFNVKGSEKDIQHLKMPKTPDEAAKVFDRCVGDIERVSLVDNYIIDIVDGSGMVIDSSSCMLELNQVKKNAIGGLVITSSLKVPRYQGPDGLLTDATLSTGLGHTNSRIDQIRTFSHVSVESCTATQNKMSGIAVNSFYGTVSFKECTSSENEGHGIVFNSKALPRNQACSASDDSEEILDNPGTPTPHNLYAGRFNSSRSPLPMDGPSFMPVGVDSF